MTRSQALEVKNKIMNTLYGKVEVIVLPVDEQTTTKIRKPSEFRGCISKDTAVAMLKQVEESRKEWERDI
jgi:hypothetical protein